ncbi:regulatory protein RecX [Geobacter anodireducens]|uniref:Regulatory protein RecX n=1 Tax=Geobacter anodireducens TaxID=1340425 RepID=A0ABR9NW64_9BACT|nr:regulatory protein RecX [Geobacter anodireducens]ANA41440.1 recombinase RecX [Geobacter anodireducens]MBE2888491.1 regulatory protein RecX [Geobacter anodireducens]HMN01598.1 regulatory protein RecX [Geobacter anodireducens]
MHSRPERRRDPLSTALDILSRRDHSEAELARKLRTRGIDAGEIDRIVARLREFGYLDDRRVACRLAESALAQGKMVGARLRVELRRRGIPPDLAEEALAQTAGCDERAMVGDLLARKFPGFDPAAADPREKRRVVGWFQRRGFGLSAILEALRCPVDE